MENFYPTKKQLSDMEVIFANKSRIEIGPTCSRRSLATLINEDSYCFLNAAIQLLYRTPQLVEELTTVVTSTDWTAEEKISPAVELVWLFKCMDETQQPVIPVGIRALIESKMPSGEQHDLHEVLILILEMVREATSSEENVALVKLRTSKVPLNAEGLRRNTKRRSVEYWHEYYKREGKSDMLKLFYGQEFTWTNCMWCFHSEFRFEFFSVLTTNVSHARNGPIAALTVDDLLSTHVACSITDASVHCRHCKSSSRKSTHVALYDSPRHLLVLVNRLNDKNDMNGKPVKLQVELDMRRYMSGLADVSHTDQIYMLYSIIEFHGSVEDGGHYTNISLCDGAWYVFNDEEISPLSQLPEYSDSVYMLAYTRRSSLPGPP